MNSPPPGEGNATQDSVVLVDGAGRPIGLADKIECHRGRGRLHRALTCVVLDEGGRLLFARRSPSKPTWPGYWDATVATHQRPDETDEAATGRRVAEELGARPAALQRVASITYQATYSHQWSEHEVCAVLLGRLSTPQAEALAPAPGEIDDLIWVSVGQLAGFIAAKPVTPWFLLAWEELVRTDRVPDWKKVSG